ADALNKHLLLDEQQLMQQTSLDAGILKTVLGEGVASGLWMEIPRQGYSLSKTFIKIKEEFLERLREFHEGFPMRSGMGKAEMIQLASAAYPKPLLEYNLNLLSEQQAIKRTGQFVAIAHFEPHLPKKWRARMEQVVNALEKDGFQAKKWEEYHFG